MSQYYDRKQAAERVDRSLSTIYRWEGLGWLVFILDRIGEDALLAADKRSRLRNGRPRAAVVVDLASRYRRYVPNAQPELFEEVVDERISQFVKFGQQDHRNGTGGQGAWVAARTAREGCQTAFAEGRGTWRHIMAEEVAEAFAESDPVKLRAELVQVMAVGLAWIEKIDRDAVKREDQAA